MQHALNGLEKYLDNASEAVNTIVRKEGGVRDACKLTQYILNCFN